VTKDKKQNKAELNISGAAAQESLEGGSYEIIQRRLQQQASSLEERLDAS
jgi:hypothetical protein